MVVIPHHKPPQAATVPVLGGDVYHLGWVVGVKSKKMTVHACQCLAIAAITVEEVLDT